ncbi:MAG: DUF2807 domain-containing protein [Gracilibacteraceae bacterium]|jgi:hypothetical protein|nr:DUF2807 domain-containing protein [Gracilibacteraceae bacterium]
MKMKRMLSWALCAVFIVVSFSGCVTVSLSPGGGGIVGEGPLESYTFPVGEIAEINVELLCDIRYYAVPADTVMLEIQANLREYIVVEESGGVLTVRATRNIPWGWSDGRIPVLTVSTPVLEGLSLRGAGDFTAYDTITADSFTLNLGGAATGKANLNVGKLAVNMSGAGDFELSGKADIAELNMSGAGNLDALPLQTRTTAVDLAGVGMVRVSCSESLRISAGGLGAVEYKGAPSLDISRGGLVSVKKLD